jgi:hypothetical protein
MERVTKVDSQVRRFKDIDYPAVYSNMMGIGATAFDISIIFGEVERAGKDEVVGIPRVKVTLSPEQAANLLIMVQAVLDGYVKGNGPLRESGRVIMPDLTTLMIAPSKSKKLQ